MRDDRICRERESGREINIKTEIHGDDTTMDAQSCNEIEKMAISEFISPHAVRVFLFSNNTEFQIIQFANDDFV